jgi:hypothetical protein
MMQQASLFALRDVEMTVGRDSVEEALIGYVQEMIGPTRTLTPETRICGELGICDEDLWDIIDHVLACFRVPPPTSAQPAQIDLKQSDITFRSLADWICWFEENSFG